MTSRSRVIVVVQARMGSSRLPGKVLADIAGKPAIERLLERVRQAREPTEVWLACSDRPQDDPLAAAVSGLGVPVLRGDENDVLSRFAAVAERTNADGIVRITGDCPLADPAVIDDVVARFRASDADFVSNTLVRSFPDGLDVEVFTRAALDRAHAEARHPFLRQHVTPYIHGRLKDRLPWGGFTNEQVVYPQDFSHLRWTLDEPADLEFLNRLYALLPGPFGWQDVVAVLTRHPELMLINRQIGLNEGSARDLDGGAARDFSRSNALFERASAVIPLASQTFSKSHQQWVRGATPLFLTHGRGARVFDPDGNSYVDYVLGLLPVVLGYRDPDVDAAIVEQVQRGITFSLPTPLETEVAERLVRLIPSAEKVRFGKNGSDVTTAAIRLARAHTGRDRVAVGGYHGWHDWYIGTTTRNLGVPADVQAQTSSFPFNDADALARLLEADPDGYAAVILEPAGVTPPAPGFLERVRALTEKYGVVLVFDEIVTGFRINLGGAQAEYGVVPDLSCFGKAMANGMPVSALVGRAEVMARMEDIFFSATFGGEALSLAAAVATLDKLERLDGVAQLKGLGRTLAVGARSAIERKGMADILAVSDVDWWPRLNPLKGPVDPWLLISLMRQEFVARGLLLGASFNLCLAHGEPGVIEETLASFEEALGVVRDALDSSDPAARLRGHKVQPTFSVRS